MFNARNSRHNIWILCGGPSTEHEVSLSSGRVVCKHISLENRQVRPVIVTRNSQWMISDRTLTSESDREWLDSFFDQAQAEWSSATVDLPEALLRMKHDHLDCAFLCFHGDYGEDGGMQGFLQTAGIPYTGSGILASAAALNKAVAIATFARSGVRVARSVRISRDHVDLTEAAKLSLPVFTKPIHGGSSLGVSLVKAAADLEAGVLHALEHDHEALVEEKIPGVEVSCGVLDLVENGQVTSRALPPTLISPVDAEFFDYEAKYVPGKSKDVTPAPLPPDVITSIQEIALKAHKALGCEGMSRTDMIVEDKPGSQPTILETQTIPGMTPTSLLPQQCAAIGITFPEFIDSVLRHALHRAGKLTAKV